MSLLEEVRAELAAELEDVPSAEVVDRLERATEQLRREEKRRTALTDAWATEKQIARTRGYELDAYKKWLKALFEALGLWAAGMLDDDQLEAVAREQKRLKDEWHNEGGNRKPEEAK